MELFPDFPIQELSTVSKLNAIKCHAQFKESYRKKYLQQRKSLIQMLRNFSDNQALYNIDDVFYLSLNYLDQILCSNYIYYSNTNLTSLAICCFSLALKFIGRFDERIFQSNLFKIQSFKQFEFKCISYLQYNLSVTSVYDYLKILTIGSMHLFQIASNILSYAVYMDYFLNYDSATFALGIMNFAREKLSTMLNSRIPKVYSFRKDKEYLSIQVIEIVSHLKSLEKNRRRTLSQSGSSSFIETKKRIPDLQLRDDYSDSTTYSTHSQKSFENDQVKEKNRRVAGSTQITKDMYSSNQFSKTYYQPPKTIDIARKTFHQPHTTRNLGIDLTQISKFNITKLNTLSGRIFTNQH